MLLIGTHGERLALAAGIDEPYGHKVRVGHRVCVCDSKGIFEDTLDGAPHVDDLVARLEELVGIVGQMVGDAAACGGIGLVNVHPSDRTASQVRIVALVLLGTADGVVEDEDAGGAGARRQSR